jgi:hypothetical protein
MKNTSIGIKFDALQYDIDPKIAVQFRFFDENDQPLKIDYSQESIEALDDEILLALHISLDVMKQLMDRVIDNRNDRVKRLAEEIQGITGESTQAEIFVKKGNATCESQPYKGENL